MHTALGAVLGAGAEKDVHSCVPMGQTEEPGRKPASDKASQRWKPYRGWAQRVKQDNAAGGPAMRQACGYATIEWVDNARGAKGC